MPGKEAPAIQSFAFNRNRSLNEITQPGAFLQHALVVVFQWVGCEFGFLW